MSAQTGLLDLGRGYPEVLPDWELDFQAVHFDLGLSALEVVAARSGRVVLAIPKETFET